MILDESGINTERMMNANINAWPMQMIYFLRMAEKYGLHVNEEKIKYIEMNER